MNLHVALIPIVLLCTIEDSLKDFQDPPNNMTKLNSKERSSLSWAINRRSFSTVEDDQSCEDAPILALPEGSEDFHRILRRFKEGFGRCVDAKRKGDFLCITPVEDS
ncbi:hypothetical protein Tco_0137930 [Tanacetum coccineum]